MTDKEQIIIDGVNIIGTIDEWARLVAHEWGTDEYSDAEIVKNYVLDINKQLARKTQECEQLQEKYEALKLENEEGYEIVDELKQECEELKKQLMQKDEVDMFFNTPLEGWSSNPCDICECKNKFDCYRKALEEIEKVCIEDTRIFADGTEVRYDSLDKILDIISKAKGEEDKQ